MILGRGGFPNLPFGFPDLPFGIGVLERLRFNCSESCFADFIATELFVYAGGPTVRLGPSRDRCFGLALVQKRYRMRCREAPNPADSSQSALEHNKSFCEANPRAKILVYEVVPSTTVALRRLKS